MRFKTTHFISHTFIKRDNAGAVDMIRAKITDDILAAGSVEHMEQIAAAIGSRLKLRKVITDMPFWFNGSEITLKEDGGMKIDMTRYISSIQPIYVHIKRKANKYTNPITRN